MMAVPVGFALPTAGGTAPPGMDTWAVLSSKKVEESGLADLVTVGLARDPSMKLVDRDRLREAAKELAFGTMLGAEGSGQRQALGRILKADALVVLGDETVDGQSLVRLVISDTRCGARLRTDYLLAEPGQTEALARTIVGRIAETRQRFSGGIRQVFGVPAFVSRNLTHDYDRLQLGYANLLAGALMSLPGVAVIETAEARQISREIALAGGADVERVVPLFIEGEFEVAGPPAVAEPTVALRVKITDGQAAGQTLAPRTLKLAEAAAFIGAELPTEIARLAKMGTVKALDADRQFAALVARARELALLGNWELSTGLREAALLLKDDVAQRTAVITEYCDIMHSKMDLPKGAQLFAGQEPFDSVCHARMGLWYAALGHLENLIRNRQVTLEEASRLADATMYGACSMRRYGNRELPAAERAKKRFAREVSPAALDLPRAGKFPWVNPWIEMLGRHLLIRFDLVPMDEEDYSLIYELMENIIPDDGTIFHVFEAKAEYLVSRGEKPSPGKFCYREDYVDFAARLKQSRRIVNALLGRYADLYLRWNDRVEAKAPTDDLFPEAERLVADIRAAKPKGAAWHWFESRASDLRYHIRPTVRPPTVPSATQAAPRPTGSNLAPSSPQPSEVALAFKEIPVQVRKLSGETVPWEGKRWEWRGGYGSIDHFLACGDCFDVMWWRSRVLLLREKGMAEEVLADPNVWFDDVQWDGRNLWVGTRLEGIWVLSPDGKVISKVGAEHGLPPADQRIKMHPIEPGRICAVGSFGKPVRAWCAIVEMQDGRPRVNVFHKATIGFTADTADTAQQYESDPNRAFTPGWMLEYMPAGGNNERVLLVSRGRRPLSIDLKTLKVGLSEHILEFSSHSWAYASRDGHLLEGGHIIALYAPPGTTFPDGKAWKSLSKAGADECLWERILPYQGWLYLPGRPWRRVNPDTWGCEAINAPEARRFEPPSTRYGVSAHYGLVCWKDDGPFYQITITEPVKQPSPAPSNP
jgi:hypothetical protein